MRNATDVMILTGIIVVLFIIGLPTLVLPFGRDQAIFGVVGETILRGGFPYRDAFDFKPPGIHLTYAVGSLISGGRVWGPHLLDLVSWLAGVGALYGLVRPLGRRAAVIAALYLGLAYLVCIRYWDLAQPESFSAALTLIALLLFRESERPAGVAAAGVAFGFAFLMKYPAILALPLFPMVARMPRNMPPPVGDIVDVSLEWRHPALRWLGLGGGWLLAVGGVAIWLIIGGALSDFLEIQTRYVPGYSQLVLADGFGVAFRASLAIATSFFTERPFLSGLPIIGLGLMAIFDRRPGRWIPAMGIVLLTIGVIAQGKFFHYHWIPLLPYLAWGSGVGIDVLMGRLERRPREAVTVGVLILILGATALVLSTRPQLSERIPATRYLAGDLDRSAFHAAVPFGRTGVGDHALGATMIAGVEAARMTRPDDTLFVWGFEPQVYLTADRRPASRFIYNAAFISPWCPREWTIELERTLWADPPALFIVISHDAIPWVTGVPMDSRSALRFYPRIERLLAERYAPAGRMEHFTFFRRSDSRAEGS